MAKQVTKTSARIASNPGKGGKGGKSAVKVVPAKTTKKAAPKKAEAKKVVPKTTLIKKPKKAAAPKKAAPAKKAAAPKKAATPKAAKAPAPAPPIRTSNTPKAESGPKGYTKVEYEKFKSETKRLQDFSNAQLKEMLKKNLQSMSGNKDEMIAKIADGIVLGQIPRCPNCFGGRYKQPHIQTQVRFQERHLLMPWIPR